MKGKLDFKLNKTLKVRNFILPYDPRLPNLENKVFGSAIRPEVSLRNYLLVDGFIKREVGKLIKKFLRHY